MSVNDAIGGGPNPRRNDGHGVVALNGDCIQQSGLRPSVNAHAFDSRVCPRAGGWPDSSPRVARGPRNHKSFSLCFSWH